MINESSRICPWWLAFGLDNPIRRLIHNPRKIFGKYIESGQTVLDLGCASGTFTIAMAKMVGETGKVIAVDVQDEMLQMVRKKAAKARLESRIITHKSEPDRIGVPGKVDFVLAFYMLHEVPDPDRIHREVASLLQPEGKLLIVEPMLHVSASSFKRTLDAAKRAGLEPILGPNIRLSRSMLFKSSRGYSLKHN